MARPAISTNQKVRNLIEKGMTTKQIVKALHVSPQVVYNTRHRVNRNKGIGALPVTGLKSTRGVAVRMEAPAKKSLLQRILDVFTG